MPVHKWRPDRLTPAYLEGGNPDSWTYAIIVLNVPISETQSFAKLWNRASWRTCADGAANQVRDLQWRVPQEMEISDPNLVCGDFDSIRPEVLEHYTRASVMVVKDDDQYSTDLAKALKYTQEHNEGIDSNTTDVIIIGSMGGRIDQAFSQLHQLYSCSYASSFKDRRLYLICGNSIAMIMDKDKNQVLTPRGRGKLTKYVGLVPFAFPSVVSTQGLEWNLNRERLEFGRFISTSNHLVDEEIEVELIGQSPPVILTLEMAV